jgi:hypothetical protein
MRQRPNWRGLLAAAALVWVGCAEKRLPDAAYPGASLDAMENPVRYAAKLKGTSVEAESKPVPKN